MISFRVGQGYDIHRLIPLRKLILGGVQIEYEFGLDGHSDADVVCHAVMDSLLGAATLGDIGQHFPNNDNSFKNADSIGLLKKVNELIKAKGYSVGNIDVNIIAERPKVAPYIAKMRANISGALNIPDDNVSVKATTNEAVGAIGRGEGIAAFAVALIYK